MKFLSSLLVAAVVGLAGCAGQGGPQGPIAEQAPGDAARQRAKVHTELGMAYLAGGQLNTALDEARIALNSDSGYSLAYNLLGLTYLQMKEHALAEEHFLQALRLAPGDPEINNNTGWFYCQTGQEPRSFAFFDTAAKNPLYTTPERALINAGLCAGRLKDYKRAEDYINHALRVAPGTLDGLYLLADTLYQLGRNSEARLRLIEVHHRAEPTAASAWLALRIERKAGERDAEIRWATHLRRKFPDSAEYRKLTQGIFE